jgi:hypothetical protein
MLLRCTGRNKPGASTRACRPDGRDFREDDEPNFKFFGSEAEFVQKAAATTRSSCVLDNSKALQAGLKLSGVVEAIERALNTWQSADSQASQKLIGIQ